MKRMHVLFLVVAALLLLNVPLARANTTFDTTALWNGTSFVSPYGNPDTATYGETFIAPSDNILNSFSFFVNPLDHTLTSKAYVFAWSGSLFGAGGGQATGSALFASPSSIVTSGIGFKHVTVNTGGVALTPGNQYVMLLTVSNPADFANTSGTGNWGIISGQHSSAANGGGGFAFYNNGNNPALLNTSVWDNFADFGTLAFTADFSNGTPVATPEPCTMALMGLGLAGAALRRKMKRT